jgi:chorismate dehydratase
MEILKIAAVSYLNTFPFVFGIKTSGELDDIDLQLHVPSVCAARLGSGEADLALVPAGALPGIPGYRIITDYCIGAESDVKTVLLMSHKPIDEIRAVHLDSDSRTSVTLARILARDHWKIDPEWISMDPAKPAVLADIESLVAIGDKTFRLAPQFPYVYDLAGEWIRFTGLPFVFAVWATCRDLPEGFLLKFNKALEYGINRKNEIPDFFRNQIPKGVNAIEYLEKNISYDFNAQKLAGLNHYLDLLKTTQK